MRQKEGKLYLNENERLAIDKDTEFHCGDIIGLLVCGVWITTSIEMNMRGEWYAAGMEGLSLVGRTVRVNVC